MSRSRGPFVGRETELAQLQSVYDAAVTNNAPAVAIVLGDPGSGKSRLLLEAVSGFDPQLVFRMRGTEVEQRIPLSAASDFLRALEPRKKGSRSETLRSPATVRAGIEPVTIFESAHRRLPPDRPVVLALDDVHWVDELTLALCSYLLRGAQASRRPLVLFAASRPSSSAATFTEGLSRTLFDPARFQEVRLVPLSKEAGVELVKRLSGESDPDFALQVWERAAGSPFWMGLLAESRVAEKSARDLVNARLRGLSAGARELMALLAIATRGVSHKEAASVLDITADSAEQAGVELISRGLVIENEKGLAPAHDLIREAAFDAIPAELARDLRRRLAELIESSAGSDLHRLVEALEHRNAAELPLLDLALRIARAPNRRLLGDAGMRRLVTIADEQGLDDPDGLALREELASLAAEMGAREVSKDQWLTIAALSSSASAQRARAYLGAARASFELQLGEDVKEYLQSARASHLGDPVLGLEIDALDVLRLRWIEGNLAEAREQTIRVETEARALASAEVDHQSDGWRRAYAAAMRIRFDVAVIEQDQEGAEKLADEVIESSRHSPGLYVRALLDSALTLLMRSQWRKAEHWLRRVWLHARREYLPSPEAEAAFWLSYVLYSSGRLNEARIVARDALQVAERVGVVPVRISLSWIRSLPHVIELSTGNWKESLSALERILDSEKDPHYRLRLRWQVALWRARLTGPAAREQVAQLIDGGLEDSKVAGCDRCSTEFTFRACEALARTGDLERASLMLSDWDSSHPPVGGAQQFWQRRADSIIAAGTSRAEGVQLLEAVRESAERDGIEFELLWLDLDRAAIEQTDQSIATYRSVLARAEEMGAATEQSLAAQRLRDLGIRSWRRSPKHETDGPLSPLSDRELEVARLVASGASNPDIAQALFLSRKTVERHVSNILGKLGIRNRARLAAFLISSERTGETPGEK